MAIVAPVLVTGTIGQDWTITITVPTDTTGWAAQADFRYFNGGTAWATKTTGAGSIVNTPGSSSSTFVITLLAADTADLFAGGYSWGLTRTDTGSDYPITDSSGCRLIGGIGNANPSFTNLSELWAALNYHPTTPDDARAQKDLQLLAAAEAFVHRYCGRRKFFYGTYTEFLTAPLKGNLRINETPIWSITSLKIDNSGGFGQLDDTFGTDTLLTAGQDYYFVVDDTDGKGYTGQVICLAGNGWYGSWWGGGLYGWGRGGGTPGLLARQPQPVPGNVKIVYIGGYALIPDDLRLAIWQIVADRRAAADVGVVMQSESMEGYSYSLGAPDAEIAKIGSVASILAGYKHGDTYVS